MKSKGFCTVIPRHGPWRGKEQIAQTKLQSQNVAARLIFLDLSEIVKYWGMGPNTGAKYHYRARSEKTKLQLQVRKQDIFIKTLNLWCLMKWKA